MVEISARAAAELAACFVVAGVATYVLYRRTTPNTPRGLRVALGAGRYIAVFLVLLLAIDPVIWIKRTQSSEPVVLVLVDDSGSMAHPTVSAKMDTAKAVLSSGLVQALEQRAAVRTFTFSDRAAEVGPTELADLSPLGSRTDLVSGLEFALEQLDAIPSDIVIVSDGGVNFGKDALHYCMGLRLPVHTLSVAEVEPTPDLSIDRLEFSEMAYAGNDVPLEIYLSGRSVASVETRLSVRDSAGTVHEEIVTVPGGGARLKKTVRINAGETGVHRFAVSLAPFEGEEVTRNNHMAFSLRVIKGKIRVCVVAPGPSWDFAFTRRNLMQDPNVDVYVHLTSRGARPLDLVNTIDDLSARLGDLDAVVLIGGEGWGKIAGDLADFVSAGGGLLMLPSGGRAAQAAGLGPLEIAGTAPPRVQPVVTAVVTEAGISHEIMNIGGTFRADLWADLPPLPLSGNVSGAGREAVVLMRSEENPALPVLAVMKSGSGKVCAFACSGLWRWDLATLGFGLDVPVYRGLLGSIVKWLVRREETERVSLTSPRIDYEWGEPVDFVVRVVDENLKGLPNAAVVGEIVSRDTGEGAGPLEFEERGTGSFSARTDFLPPGRYSARVSASAGGSAVGADAMVFDIQNRGLEDVSFDGDDVLLKDISAVTGGGHYHVDDIAGLASGINPGEVVVNKLDEVRFRLGVATFGFILLLLASEWLVRKRRMLP
jgi:hypothetical protein